MEGLRSGYFIVSGCGPTSVRQPRLGPARLVNAMGIRDGSISDVGDLLSVVIGHADMPRPG
ncbi:MAG TPA: hypothetical protein HA349_09245 [Methanotrichaceae archaeon]|nr:hypothetical protein [Methanotrichaceae archaeon]